MKNKLKKFIKNRAALFNVAFFVANIGREVRSFLGPLLGKKLRADSRLGFHSDPAWRGAVSAMLRDLPITSVLETGTYQGDTTAYLAENFSGRIFTGEVMGLYYRESKWRLRGIENVKIFNQSSPEMIRHLIDKKLLGDLPLIFLDAHWYHYWPLLDELRAIRSLSRAIVIIDDFKVPGRPYFGFDSQDGKIDEDLDFITPQLDMAISHIFFPKYGRPGDRLRGHIVIFQNASAAIGAISKNPAFSENYEEYHPVRR